MEGFGYRFAAKLPPRLAGRLCQRRIVSLQSKFLTWWISSMLTDWKVHSLTKIILWNMITWDVFFEIIHIAVHIDFLPRACILWVKKLSFYWLKKPISIRHDLIITMILIPSQVSPWKRWYSNRTNQANRVGDQRAQSDSHTYVINPLNVTVTHSRNWNQGFVWWCNFLTKQHISSIFLVFWSW